VLDRTDVIAVPAALRPAVLTVTARPVVAARSINPGPAGPLSGELAASQGLAYTGAPLGIALGLALLSMAGGALLLTRQRRSHLG